MPTKRTRGVVVMTPRARTPHTWVGAGLALTLCIASAACTAPEPTVVVYVAGGTAVAGWLEDAYRSAHPEEVLRLEAMGGPAVLGSLRAGGAEAVPDVWLGAPTWILARAAGEGLLVPASPSWADDVPAAMRDPGGRWVGWSMDPTVLAFNTDRTSRSRAPGDWLDLFHPRWSGDVLLPDAQGSPIMEAFIGTVVAQMTAEAAGDDPGFDWLVRLDANRRDYVAQGDVALRLWSGEASVALLSLSQAQAAKADGRPVDFRVPESGSPTLVRGVAQVVGAPHPDGAATFLEWLGSPAARAAFTERFLVLPATTGAVEGEPSWVTELRPLLRTEVAPADTLAAHLGGWLERWRRDVMGRTPPPLF